VGPRNDSHGTPPEGGSGRLRWLTPLAPLAAIAAALVVVRRPPGGLLGLVLLALLGAAVGWIVVSTLWPARAERTCPRCGRDGLARIDRWSTIGLRCRDCGWRDESRSSWLLAEEEGPLERTVLRQRSRRPASSPRRTTDAPRATNAPPAETEDARPVDSLSRTD